jgi:molybdenum cofactor biosynthesis enzyme MoaA
LATPVHLDRREPICAAPGASMYLDPTGTVAACCQNTTAPLGSTAASTLQGIWHGPAASELRRRMTMGDLSMGCQECEGPVASGHREQAYLTTFDHLVPVPAEGLPWPRRLELALSNTCNLQCTMCNGDLSSAIRSQREGRPPLPNAYGDAFFEQLTPFLDHVEEISFLGGEPFLATETWRVIDLLHDGGLRPRCTVTTNGTVWTPRVERFLAELPWCIVVSVDGARPETFESIRVGASFERVSDIIDRFRSAAAEHDGQLLFAHSLMPQNAPELPELLAWADRLDVDVGVNDVAHPTRFSLAHLDTDQLHAVLAGWRDDPSSQGLSRNAPVLRAQVERVERLLDEHSRRGLLGVPNMDLPRVGTPGHDVQGAAARFEGWLAESGGTVEWLTIDAAPGGRVTALSSTGGVDLPAHLVGAPIDEVVTSLLHSLGGLRSAHQLDRSVDHLDVVDEVGDGTLRAVLTARRDEHGIGTGVQLLAAFRRRAAAASG